MRFPFPRSGAISLLVPLLAAAGPLAFVGCVPAAARAAPAAAGGPTDIAVVLDGPWARFGDLLDRFPEEITGLCGEEFGVRFPEAYRYEADWTAAGVRAAMDRALANPDVEAVLALGILAGIEVASRPERAKPVVAPFGVFPGMPGVPFAGGRSGAANLSYLTAPGGFPDELESFRSVVPFERAVLLVQSPVPEIVPGLAERAAAVAAEIGIELQLVAVGTSGVEAAAAIPDGVEAVLLAPLPRLSEPELDALAAGLIERRLPSWSMFGAIEVEAGILAGATPADDWARRARRTALDLQRILQGGKASELSVLYAPHARLHLNLATARAVGARPTWETLTEAVVVDREREDIERVLDLGGTVREAVRANRSLIAERAAADAAAEDVGSARANLLPSVDLSSTGIWREDEASSFAAPGWRWTGSAALSQVLWSDDALTALEAARRGAAVAALSYDALELDVAQSAATSYLELLQAKTSERVQTENLRRTQENLELAKIRREVGTSGPAEVYRWEGEIARSRAEVIRANSRRNAAEIALNRLLHRPLEEAFVTIEADLLDERVGISDPRLQAYLGDPWSFRILREFLAGEAIRKSPEVAAIDESIAAQHRLVKNTQRSFWMPEIGAQAEVTRELDRGGVGETGYAAIPGPVGGVGLLVLEPNETSWSVGLSASVPLFEGARRVSDRRRARSTLRELETRREAVVEGVEQRVRTALHLAGASHAAIALRREEAEAARRNRELVLDAYSRGLASVVDLIDAQTNALVAEEGAANAVHEFLIDLMEVERAAGHPVCLGAPDEDEAFLERLEAFRDEREER